MDFGEKVLAVSMVLVFGFAGLMVLFFLLLPFISIQSPGEGEHTGYITAVERTGVVWKTWTAYVKTDTESTQEDLYCVEDPGVVAELQTAQRNKALVNLAYRSELIVGQWRCGHEGAIITDVR